MTGRCSHMEVPRTARRGPQRLGRVLAGLLCVLGVLAAAGPHPAQTGHHRMPALAAATAAGDTHTTRTDLQLIQAQPGSLAHRPGWSRSVATPDRAAQVAAIRSVRTRGPPELA